MTHAHAIDPAHLETVRTAGEDGHGNAWSPYPASGDGEPLRCCLRYARAGEPIALISYAPLPGPSPWREVGPVYVHADPCSGWDADGRANELANGLGDGPGDGLPDRLANGLPDELRRGPRVLRTYRPDGTMNYDHNTLTDEEDLEPLLDKLLVLPDVATVHVRTVLPQCFLYAVTA